MKKYLTIAITLFALTITFGQDQITWNEVGVVAKDGYANNIVQTMDNFYGNIENARRCFSFYYCSLS